MPNNETPRRCQRPEECRVMDWMLASDLPEWNTHARLHLFRPPGAGEQEGDTWRFTAGRVPDFDAPEKLLDIWMREA